MQPLERCRGRRTARRSVGWLLRGHRVWRGLRFRRVGRVEGRVPGQVRRALPMLCPLQLRLVYRSGWGVLLVRRLRNRRAN